MSSSPPLVKIFHPLEKIQGIIIDFDRNFNNKMSIKPF